MTLKTLHVGLVLLSLAGFSLRGWWMLRDSPWLRHRATRVLPHMVDTLLLISGAGLAYVTDISPLEHSWLAVKLLALVGYILLGTVALKRGRTKTRRTVALAGALCLFAYMLAVAVGKNPMPWA